MISDANKLSDNTKLDADICIAGGGAAGISIARHLIPENLSVILLEGGPLNASDSPGESEHGDSLYDGYSKGLPINISEDRIRAFGGSTNHWGAWCTPLGKDDFSSGGYPPKSNWPIGRDELLPYYREAQKTCDLGGFDYNAEAIAEREDSTLLDLENSHLKTIVYQNSTPPSKAPVPFGEKYRSELENAENIDVYVHANLVEILPSNDENEIRRFECKTIKGLSFEVEADYFVLALGGIENPRLLLASTSQNPQGIGNDNDLVGRYFMQHPHFDSEFYVILNNFDNSFYRWHYEETFDETRNEYINTNILGGVGMEENIRRNDNLPNIVCTLQKIEADGNVVSPRVNNEPMNTESIPKEDDSRSFQMSNERSNYLLHFLPEDMDVYKLYLRAEQRPIETSRVRLVDETDELGIPRVEVNWIVPDKDIELYHKYLKQMGKELANTGKSVIWPQSNKDGGPKVKKEKMWGAGHHMGTTRMSKRPDLGVVNENCRVHSTSNLYVAGSSVFPTVGYANPTLTIVALAHRLGDHLTEMMT